MKELRILPYRKKRGPKTEPWGTPVVRVRGEDTDPLHITCQERPARQDEIQECAQHETPSSEGGEEELMVHSVKGTGKIQEDENRGERVSFGSAESLRDREEQSRLSDRS